MLINSEASLSVRLLRNPKLLSSTTVTQNKLSVGYFNTCNTHLTHSAEHISPCSTLHCQFTVLHTDSVIAFLSPPTPCTSVFLLEHFHPHLNGCVSCSVPPYVSRTTDAVPVRYLFCICTANTHNKEIKAEIFSLVRIN